MRSVYLTLALAATLSALNGCTGDPDQVITGGPDYVAPQRPEKDTAELGTLRHGQKFGVEIGMTKAEADKILATHHSENVWGGRCINRKNDAGCIGADAFWNYVIDRHGIFLGSAAINVELSFKGGKVIQIDWWEFKDRLAP